MEVSVLGIVVLVVVFLVLGLLLTKFRGNRYVPYIGIVGAVFFLVYAFVDRDYLYPSLFFFLIFGYLSYRALVVRRKKEQ